MAGHHALVEDDAALGIDAGGDIGRRHLARLRAQLVRVLRQCQRMQVDDAEDAVVVALQRDPVSDGAEIIAEMQIAGGLDAREDAVHGAVGIAAASDSALTQPATVSARAMPVCASARPRPMVSATFTARVRAAIFTGVLVSWRAKKPGAITLTMTKAGSPAA